MQPIRIVMVEDSSDDMELCRRALEKGGLAVDFRRVASRQDLREALASFDPHVVLSDFFLPHFDGLRAIGEVRSRAPDVPVILVTGALDEETAADCIRAGAVDYVMKDGLVRLPVAVRSALTRRLEAEARRMAEDELRKVSRAVEQSPNAVLIADTDGRIEYVNPRFTELTGYDPADVIGRPADLAADAWEAVRAGQEWRGEVRSRRKDGATVWERVVLSPVRNGGGAVTHFVCVREDITGWKERQRALHALPALTAALESVATLEQCCGAALRVLSAELAAEAAGAALFDPEGGARIHGAGFAADTALAVMRADRRPSLGTVPAPDGTWSLLVMPLLVTGGRLVAGVWLGRKVGGAEGAFGESDLALLAELGPTLVAAFERTALREETDRRLRRLLAMNAIDEAIAGNHDLHAMLDTLFEHVLRELDVDGACVLLFDPARQELELVADKGVITGPDPGFRIGIGQSVSGRAALERRVVLSGEGHEIPIPGHRLAVNRRFIASAPLMVQGQVVGALTVVRTEPSAPGPEWIHYFQALADQSAIAVETARLVHDLQRSNEELTRAYDATIEGWVRALDLRDHETEGHTQRVTAMTLRLARAVGLPEQDLVHVRRGALLHDIGKMAVPDSILRKPGPLTAEERAVMERHPTTAWEMLSGIAYLEPALDIPWCHHERWDGRGYPRGLRGEDIPLAARIFALVDVWDALRSDRVYRAAWPEAEVRAFLRDGAGTQFDPALVQEFMAVLAEADVDSGATEPAWALPRSIASARSRRRSASARDGRGR